MYIARAKRLRSPRSGIPIIYNEQGTYFKSESYLKGLHLEFFFLRFSQFLNQTLCFSTMCIIEHRRKEDYFPNFLTLLKFFDQKINMQNA